MRMACSTILMMFARKPTTTNTHMMLCRGRGGEGRGGEGRGGRDRVSFKLVSTFHSVRIYLCLEISRQQNVQEEELGVQNR